jgi:hypothetical protein
MRVLLGFTPSANFYTQPTSSGSALVFRRCLNEKFAEGAIEND